MDNYCSANLKNQEPDLSEAFPGSKVSDRCANFVLSQDGSYAGDQLTFDQEVRSYIQANGYPVLYYPYLYEIDKSEKIHGEHSAAGYGKPFQVIMSLTIEDAPSWVSAAGVDNEVTVTGWLHIRTWKNLVKGILSSENDDRKDDYSKIYNLNYIEDRDIIHAIEPKPKDLFQLMTYGCDREYDRGNKIFEITNKEDELFSQNMNMGMGHYVWRIMAKRYRYSYEDGMSTLDFKSADNFYLGNLGEKGNHQVYDNRTVAKMFLGDEGLLGEDALDLSDEEKEELITENGIIPVVESFTKAYKEDIDEESKKEFDMEKNRLRNYYQDQQSNITWGGYL